MDDHDEEKATVRTVGDWNSIPSHVVEQLTAASFKAELSRLTSAAYAP